LIGVRRVAYLHRQAINLAQRLPRRNRCKSTLRRKTGRVPCGRHIAEWKNRTQASEGQAWSSRSTPRPSKKLRSSFMPVRRKMPKVNWLL